MNIFKDRITTRGARGLGQVVAAQRGAIAPIAALAVTAILFTSVFALDAARLFGATHKSQLVADSAALNAASLIREQLDQGLKDQINPVEIRQVAENAFRQQLGLHNLTLKDLVVDFRQEGDDYIVKLDYQVEMPRIVSDTPMVIRKSSSAMTNFTQSSAFMDIHLVLDMSGSMSTGATIEDQVELWKTDGCAFACHEVNVKNARNKGILLRQDLLAAALRTLGDVAEAALSTYSLDEASTQFNIWGFHTGYWSMGKTTDIDTFKVLTDAVNDRVPAGATNIGGALEWVAQHHLPESGDGFSPDTRKTFVFLITDGVATHHSDHQGRGRGLVKLASCERVKATGATLGVIYTKYENYANSYFLAHGSEPSYFGSHAGWSHAAWTYHYNRHVRPTETKIPERFRECASPDFYMETSSPAELRAALGKLYENAIEQTKGQPRLSS